MLLPVEVAGVLISAGDWLEACATEFAMPGEFGEGCSLTTGTDSVADSKWAIKTALKKSTSIAKLVNSIGAFKLRRRRDGRGGAFIGTFINANRSGSGTSSVPSKSHTR